MINQIWYAKELTSYNSRGTISVVQKGELKRTIRELIKKLSTRTEFYENELKEILEKEFETILQ